MNFYRSSIASGNAGDITASYTAKVNKQLQQTSAAFYFFQNKEFNDSVIIGNNINDCREIFRGCDIFNNNVIIGRNVKDCSLMFEGCTNFNKNVIIPDSVENCNSMFSSCSNFRADVVFGKGMKDCAAMFQYCRNVRFNKDIVLPIGVESAVSMFANCYNLLTPNIYINNPNCKTAGMLGDWQNNRINIYCNDLNEIMNNPSYTLVGPYITWYEMTNGFYNSRRNIYLYNNYIGT